MTLKLRIAVLFLAVACVQAFGQSTFGAVVGNVKDRSGAAVPNASVTLRNVDENVSRETTTKDSGDYQFLNIPPGHHSVTATASGFDTFSATELNLVARQTLRVDVDLQVGQSSQVVTVEPSNEGVIATETQAIQATFNPQQLLNLPANVRANGNTSPYQLIQVLPGVQADDSGNFSIQGGIQSQTQYSLEPRGTGRRPDRVLISRRRGGARIGSCEPSSAPSTSGGKCAA